MIIEKNDDTLTRAEDRSIQTITNTAPITAEQPSQSLDKFTAYPDLKPKYLEKESNLLDSSSKIIYHCRVQDKSTKKVHLQIHKPTTSPNMDH